MEGQELENKFIEEYEAAHLLLKAGKYKSSTILLAKAMFALTDYIIFKKYQKLPKNHSERFRVLELKDRELYLLLDDVWGRYTDTYSKPATEEAIKLLKEAIQAIARTNETISQKIKICIEKEQADH